MSPITVLDDRAIQIFCKINKTHTLSYLCLVHTYLTFSSGAFSDQKTTIFFFLIMAENRFSVDYAKVSTSSCKKCKTKIGKGQIRIAKISPSPFSEGDTMKLYHHVDCLFETFVNARATTKILESTTDLDGWEDVNPTDREKILEHIKHIQEIRVKKSPTKKSKPKKTTNTNEDEQVKADFDDPPATENIHVPVNDDPKHPDNSFRQFRGLCTKIAETNGHLAKTAIVQEFVTYGSDGESYKGENRLIPECT